MPRKDFQGRLIKRLFIVLSGLVTAAPVAMVLYALSRYAMEIAPHFTMIASYGAAGFLIAVYTGMTFMTWTLDTTRS